ncbi:UDP-glucose 4-epimerase GalE [Streptomyces sp. WZ-12]|uniref:UDP-glucose 4-epimerase GalE n=1 Tax=Streptomyces sp. WZ-12 TaxID=3030210 RepID=UPI002381096E|nr:UDP-glucose 4-epimerase GalE [Streptomyces sp. WZ-12]
MKILITGGAGFIGSTIASACLDVGITPVILDNLSTGRREFTKDRAFYEGDVADAGLVDKVFSDHPDIYGVIHCASLIVVPESMTDPLRYYRENVAKGILFFEHLARNDCQRLLFSSSAAIFQADGERLTVDEDSPLAPGSPYAQTKAMLEKVIADVSAAGQLRSVSLRYFNPIGADPRLRTGLQVLKPTHALGAMIECHHSNSTFTVTGTDFPTKDGSGIRDYVHVWDIAQAHIAALRQFDSVLETEAANSSVIILGSGKGTTVKDLVRIFEKVTGQPLTHAEVPRRPGDQAGAYSGSNKAAKLLGWRPMLTVEQAVQDSLAWHAKRADILGQVA